MSSPETLEQAPDQLNPEDIQRMIAEGQLNPSMYPEYAQYAPADPNAQPGIDPYNSFPSVEIPEQRQSIEQETVNAAQEAATAQLIKAETEALKKASAETAPEAVQKAQHDQDVVAAEHAVEEAYAGTSVTAIEQTAIEQAIDLSPIETVEKTDLARTAAEGRSTTEQAKQAAPEADKEVAEGYAELKDKVDGDANKYVTRVSKRTAGVLSKMGLRVGRNKLKGQIAAAGGAELTDVAAAHEVEQQVAAHDFIEAAADGKNRGNRAKFRETVQVLKENGMLGVVREAVSRRKGGGNVSAGTERRVGKKLMRAFGKH